jgi:hypothetical protein
MRITRKLDIELLGREADLVEVALLAEVHADGHHVNVETIHVVFGMSAPESVTIAIRRPAACAACCCRCMSSAFCAPTWPNSAATGTRPPAR